MPEIGDITSRRVQRLVAIVFIGCLMVLFLTGFDTIKSKARDIKRRADIKNVIKALDLYHDKYGKYPDSKNEWQGWDLSVGYNGGQPDFLSELRAEKFIDRDAADPVNDLTSHYRYQRLQPGDYGCASAYYILQVTNFELSTEDNGRGECPGLNWAELVPNGYTVQDTD